MIIDRQEVLEELFSKYKVKRLVEYNLANQLKRISGEVNNLVEEAKSFCPYVVGDTFEEGESPFIIEEVILAFDESGDKRYFLIKGEGKQVTIPIESLFNQGEETDGE